MKLVGHARHSLVPGVAYLPPDLTHPLSASFRRMGARLVDRHFTPSWAIEALLNAYATPAGNVLEPARGIDQLLPALSQHHRNKGTVYASDWADHWWRGNFLGQGYYWKQRAFGCILTNPPYRYAQEFVIRAHTLLDKHWGGDVVMLLRINFLASIRRRDFWRQYPLKYLVVLEKRPSFAGGPTDMTEYAWFVWSTRDDVTRRVGTFIASASADNGWTEQRQISSTILHVGMEDAEAFRRRLKIG